MKILGMLYRNVIIDGIIKDIQTLRANNGLRGVLILTYCAIDILAFLSLPLKKKDVTKKDFINWVKKYMSQYNAIEIYSARCALVHTYSAESKLSRKGFSRKISYSYMKHNRHIYIKLKNIILYDTNILIDDFIKGSQNWAQKIISSKQLKNRVIKRLPYQICDIKG